MFKWLSQKCPLATAEKYWAESQMQWFADVLGIDRMIETKVLLSADMYVTDSYSGSWEEVSEIMLRLMDHMKIRGSNIRLEVCDNKEMPDAAGLYCTSLGITTIRISDSVLSDPDLVVSTLAHELSHEILIGGGFLHPDEPDHEWITDLLTVFLGVGVIVANSTTRESNTNLGGGMYLWEMSRLGYLPVRIYGYALSLFANYRGETKPAWAEHLRRNAIIPFRQGLNYVRKTGDCLFLPESDRNGLKLEKTKDLLDTLKSRFATFRLAALMAFEDRNERTSEFVDSVIGSLNDRDTAVREQAVRLAARFVPEACRSIGLIVDALGSPVASLRATAARTLGTLEHRPELVVGELVHCLGDENRDVVIESVVALTKYGRSASKGASIVAKRFSQALLDCDDELSDYLAESLYSVSDDPWLQVREQFATKNPELIERALAAIERIARRES